MVGRDWGQAGGRPPHSPEDLLRDLLFLEVVLVLDLVLLSLSRGWEGVERGGESLEWRQGGMVSMDAADTKDMIGPAQGVPMRGVGREGIIVQGWGEVPQLPGGSGPAPVGGDGVSPTYGGVGGQGPTQVGGERQQDWKPYATPELWEATIGQQVGGAWQLMSRTIIPAVAVSCFISFSDRTAEMTGEPPTLAMRLSRPGWLLTADCPSRFPDCLQVPTGEVQPLPLNPHAPAAHSGILGAKTAQNGSKGQQVPKPGPSHVKAVLRGGNHQRRWLHP